MNAIQIRDRIDFYNDLTRNARFYSQDYNNAVNSVILTYIDQILLNARGKGLSGFQTTEFVRDRLSTLISTNTPTITNGTVVTGRYGTFTPSTFPKPSDFQNFVSLRVLIDGYSDYSRPTNYNEEFPTMDNIFMKPTNQKTYYNETAAGWTVWRGVGGTFTSALLTYLKAPATYNVGAETSWINAGAGVLTLAASYIALETSVQNGVTYQSGTAFNAAVTTTLTSGKVILASNTTTCDLPDATHDTIARQASSILLGTTSNYPASAFVEKEVSKNN